MWRWSSLKDPAFLISSCEEMEKLMKARSQILALNHGDGFGMFSQPFTPIEM